MDEEELARELSALAAGQVEASAQALPTLADFEAGLALGLYQAPIACGVAAGLVLGMVGVFVVLRRMVFVTAAVSQAAGLGVALSFFLAIHADVPVDPHLGAALLSLAMAGFLAVPPERVGLSRESMLGLAYVTSWALAVLVGDRIVQESHDISAILFGSAVLVRDLDLALVLGVGALTLGTHVYLLRGFAFALFDPEGARVQGLPVGALELASWLLVALFVAVATRALGVLPVFAFAVLPAMAGLALFDRLRPVLLTAAAVGALSGGLGYVFAFFRAFPVGASQAAVAVASLVACALVGAARRRWTAR